MTDRHDDDEFQAAQELISDYRTPPEDGQNEFWGVDDTGFKLPPRVPYAWQPVGETLAIPAPPRRRLQVLGLVIVANR